MLAELDIRARLCEVVGVEEVTIGEVVVTGRVGGVAALASLAMVLVIRE